MNGRRLNALMQGSRAMCVGIVAAVAFMIYLSAGNVPLAVILGAVAVPAIAIAAMILWGGFRT